MANSVPIVPAEDAEAVTFKKLAMIGYIVYTLFGLDSQSEEFQNILKYLGVGFCICYGRRTNHTNPNPNPENQIV